MNGDKPKKKRNKNKKKQTSTDNLEVKNTEIKETKQTDSKIQNLIPLKREDLQLKTTSDLANIPIQIITYSEHKESLSFNDLYKKYVDCLLHNNALILENCRLADENATLKLQRIEDIRNITKLEEKILELQSKNEILQKENIELQKKILEKDEKILERDNEIKDLKNSVKHLEYINIMLSSFEIMSILDEKLVTRVMGSFDYKNNIHFINIIRRKDINGNELKINEKEYKKLLKEIGGEDKAKHICFLISFFKGNRNDICHGSHRIPGTDINEVKQILTERSKSVISERKEFQSKVNPKELPKLIQNAVNFVEKICGKYPFGEVEEEELEIGDVD